MVVFGLLRNYNSFAQVNLVPNWSFETITSCDSLGGGFDFSIAPPWDSPNWGSPDLFNPCASNSNFKVPINFAGYQQPHSDIGYAGAEFFQLGTNTFREYIQVHLDSVLVVQHKYCVTFYVSLSSVYACASNNIGMYFSSTHTFMPFTSRLNLIPQILDTNIVSDTANWTAISGEYIANGGEKYIIICNFNVDTTVHTMSVGGGIDSYYYIDDVSVWDCTGSGLGVGELSNENNIIISPNPTTGIFTISTEGNKIKEVKVVDVVGEIIRNYELGIRNSVTFDMTGVSKGIYFVQIMDDKNNVVNRKVVIN